MPFYLNKCGFFVNGCDILIIHNIITGAKQVYINNIISMDIRPKLFDCSNTHMMMINGEKYEIIIEPGWSYKYQIISRQHGYGLLDDTLI